MGMQMQMQMQFALPKMAAAFLGSFSLRPNTSFRELPHPKPQVALKPHFLNLPMFPPPTSVKRRRPYISLKPTSASQSPPYRIPNFSPKSISAFLLASLVFAGYLNAKPVSARPLLGNVGLQEKANGSLESGETEEEIMLLKLLEGDPRNMETLKMIVNSKMERQKMKEAVEYVEKLIDLQPNEMEWRLLQALCYEMMGDLSKAKSLYRNILKQNPLLLRALHGLAMVMHKRQEGAAVLEMLDAALETARREDKASEEHSIRVLIAQMHVVKGELEEALATLQALIDENPRDFRPYLCEGIVYGLLGKTEEADECFEIYRSLVPEEYPHRGFMDEVYLNSRAASKSRHSKRTSAPRNTSNRT